MKKFSTLLIAAIALSCLGWQAAEAREYKVQNIGMKGLEASCGRGGGTFVETEGGYHCGYKNGNVRECSKSSKECVVITPSNLVGTSGGGFSGLATFDASNMAVFN